MWTAFGFGAEDFAGEGSDRLIDALVAWGSVDTIKDRLDAHRASGADEVVVIPLDPDGGGRAPDRVLVEALAA